jgi:hypothetical protein
MSSSKKETPKSRDSLSRRELRSRLRKAPSRVSSGSSWTSSSRRFDEKERVKLGKDVFGKKYGNYISKSEFKDAMKKLDRAKIKAKSSQERKKIETQKRFLKQRKDFLFKK